MERTEAVVARAGDLEDGGLQAAKVGDAEVLLARVGGRYHAVGARCPHYGAPLEQGLLNGARLVCPWHHACFDVTDGSLLEPPSLDPLPRYAVRLDGDDVIIALPALEPPPPPRRGEDRRTFAILGGGAAGAAAAETLRRHDFAGRVVLVTREERLPYDRPKLSKGYLQGKAGPDELPIRDARYYAALGIELASGRTVARVNVPARRLELEDGGTIEYDACLLATGGIPRRLEVPGADLEGVLTLRDPADADRLVASADDAAGAVIVGSGFIGMEAAASLRARRPELEVHVVTPETVPFGKVLGEAVGRMLQGVHEEHGVRFHLGAHVARLEGRGRVEALVLEDGRRIAADLVLVAIGARPATGVVAGLELARDGGVPVDARLRAADGLYAAGDVARFPDPRTGEPVRIEHWRVALQHGRTAALNMLGLDSPYAGIPFFWTGQHGLQLRYVGHAPGFDEVVLWGGDPADREFVAFYAQAGRVLAASGLKRDRELDAVEELMRTARMPPLAELRSGPVDLAARLRA